MSRRRLCTQVATLSLSLLAAGASRADDALAAAVDRLAAPYVESETVIGMTVGVVRGDESVVRGYGRLSSDDSRKPDGDTLYEVGSVSKVFTGLLLADAVAQGRVSLVTPVEDLLPSGVTMNRRHESLPIRLWHLSTHSSGLPRLPDNLLEDADPNNPYAHYSGKELAEFLRGFQPRKRPGETFEYSNLGVGLLGDLLAREQKMNYETLLKERITKPLGMTSTTVTLEGDARKRLAPPHLDGGVPGHNWDFSRLGGCGAIRSSAADLVALAKAHLHPPEGKLGHAIDLAWTVHQKPIEGGSFALGLGWHVARDGSTRWHNGQTGGYHAAVFVSRDLDAASVVLTNTATGEVDRLAEDLVRMAAGANVEPRKFDKQFKVAPEVMQRYAGKYRFAPGLEFTFTVNSGRLMAQLSGQGANPVYPRTETEWFYKVVDAQLTFELNGRGECTAVVLHQNGIDQTARRVR